jgi:transposase InsO family protein
MKTDIVMVTIQSPLWLTDQGASYMSHQFKEFASALKIKLLNSLPYYAQANGQAKSSNKVLIKLIKKKIDEHMRRWHEVLSEALWARRTSRHSATKVTPFELVYGQEAVLPVEINLQTCRIAKRRYPIGRRICWKHDGPDR